MSYGELVKGKNLNPATVTAIQYLDYVSMYTLQKWKKHLLKLEDNNTAQQCVNSINKLLKGEEIKELELLSLAWVLRFDLYETLTKMEEKATKERKRSKDDNRLKR
jgi:hypothetical protein